MDKQTSPRSRSNSKSKGSNGKKLKHRSDDEGDGSRGLHQRSVSFGNSSYRQRAGVSSVSPRADLLQDDNRSSSEEHGNPFADDDAADTDKLLVKTEPLSSVLGGGGGVTRSPSGRRVSIGQRGGDVPADIMSRPLASTPLNIPSHSSPNLRESQVRGVFSPAVPSLQSTSPRDANEEEINDIMNTAPELTPDTKDKHYTPQNVYLNIKKDLLTYIGQLENSMKAQNAAVTRVLDTNLRQIRQNQVNLQYLVTDISRGAVYTVEKEAMVELRAPQHKDTFKKPTSACGCFPWWWV